MISSGGNRKLTDQIYTSAEKYNKMDQLSVDQNSQSQTLPKLRSAPKLKSAMSTPVLKVKSPMKDFMLSNTSKVYNN